MTGVVDSYGFMQLDPFVRCNSHWVRDFFPVDDGETLKDANRTGAYKYQPIIQMLPNYTERELLGLTKREELEHDRAFLREQRHIDWAEVRREIVEDGIARREEAETARASKRARPPYVPRQEVLVHPPQPPTPYFGDGRTSWLEARPDDWDHLNLGETQIVHNLATPSKDDPPQVKELIATIIKQLKKDMSTAVYTSMVVTGWDNFFTSLEEIPKLRGRLLSKQLEEPDYEI